jgi:hypothetical protein
MPQISQFLGISVRIHFADHSPPHLHAYYAGQEVMVELANGAVRRGGLPPTQQSRLLQWMGRHREELDGAWHQAVQQLPPSQIPYP